MSQFLRDIKIANINVTEQTLESINHFLIDRLVTANSAIDAKSISEKEKADQRLALFYVIRFDNRGYRLYDAQEAFRFYQQAAKVERVIFTLDSAQSERTNRMYGTYCEVRFDANDPNNCNIQVSSDDGDAVDAIYNGILEIVGKSKSLSGFARTTWTQFLVQILGVAGGFILSLITAIKASPHLKFENSFVLTFLFAFLIFSNSWGFINQQILRLINYSFPNIRFSREGKGSFTWLFQALVGGILVALFLLIFSELMDWVGNILGGFIGDN
ncbi:hypothetical protein MWU49_07100 [Alcanivorax sp. S6407]|uniref:hypothetical protein n=1 Tax=Alcanivorax sp. S6407 TaxID=2926424 RepID=UPI001FF2DDC0|nr:hypothetical protein [Alcanivorax sp. S6407]MCK0153462.1 hypothetical protein [Alcanivorax sp. S6407]